MSYKILLEVTVLSSTGAVAVDLKTIEFNHSNDANQYYESVEVYEETSEIKVWRQVTKLY